MKWLAVFILTCACFREATPRSSEEKRALSIAGEVFGVDFMPIKPPQLSVTYLEPTCTDMWNGLPGDRTAKGNCSCGFLAPYTPHITVVRQPGQRLSDTCFCGAAKQAQEMSKIGWPDTYCVTDECKSGERKRIVDACSAKLREVGL